MRHLRSGTCLAVLCFAVLMDSAGQEVGTCNLGRAEALLDANQVRAKIFNAGQLFWNGSGPTYTVPKSDANAIFAANIWIGGLVDGELRFAGSDYRLLLARPWRIAAF